jgi:signal transduction histidine kinase
VVHLISLEKGHEGLEGLMTMMNQTMLKLEHAMESLLHYTNNRQNSLSREKLNIVSVVQQAIEYSRRMKGFERMQINTNIEADTPFYSDAYRVQLVIQHLMANSIAFQDLSNSDPFVNVTVAVQPEWVTICLEDNGVGVPPENVPLIFDRFVKASEQSSGSGLGLYIVKEVLKKLDGTIDVLSVRGKGTSFTVRIPNRPTA